MHTKCQWQIKKTLSGRLKLRLSDECQKKAMMCCPQYWMGECKGRACGKWWDKANGKWQEMMPRRLIYSNFILLLSFLSRKMAFQKFDSDWYRPPCSSGHYRYVDSHTVSCDCFLLCCLNSWPATNSTIPWVNRRQ